MMKIMLVDGSNTIVPKCPFSLMSTTKLAKRDGSADVTFLETSSYYPSFVTKRNNKTSQSCRKSKVIDIFLYQIAKKITKL